MQKPSAMPAAGDDQQNPGDGLADPARVVPVHFRPPQSARIASIDRQYVSNQLVCAIIDLRHLSGHQRVLLRATRWRPGSRSGSTPAPRLLCRQCERTSSQRLLRARSTRDLYESLLRNHSLPGIRERTLADIDEAAVRRWRKERLDTGKVATRPFGPVTVAKAYRLLHAVLETAQTTGSSGATRAGSTARERRNRRSGDVSLPVVFAVAERFLSRYRSLVLLGDIRQPSFGRTGRAAARERRPQRVRGPRDRDDSGTGPRRAGARNSEVEGGPPDSGVPGELVPELRWHLDRFAAPGSGA